jgi:CxxC-x17-CxxC domain-containing protein
MKYTDKLLICADCGNEFVFSAGEQLFFFDKQFRNDPKHCKPCKAIRQAKSNPAGASPLASARRTETQAECSGCGIQTTVPFKPTRGRPVLCRECFEAQRRTPPPPVMAPPESTGSNLQ